MFREKFRAGRASWRGRNNGSLFHRGREGGNCNAQIGSGQVDGEGKEVVNRCSAHCQELGLVYRSDTLRLVGAPAGVGAVAG